MLPIGKRHAAIAMRPRPFRPWLERLEDRLVPATFLVTTRADILNPTDGVLSLREAIDKANATGAPDTIVLFAGVHRITRAGSNEDANQSGDFDILNALTLKGPGAAAAVIDGNGLDRVFHVLPATPFTAKFSGVTIRGGFTGDLGGGVHVDDTITNAVNLIVTKSIITGNAATNNFGGGIHIQSGGLTLTDTIVSNNSTASDDGGGIFFNGSSPATITRCKITGNTAGNGGGFAHNGPGLLTLTDCLISGNAANGQGGGVFVNGSNAVINRCVIQGNSASQEGGGIGTDGSAGNLTLSRTTISGNRAFREGGGVYDVGTATFVLCKVIGNNSFGVGGGIASTGILSLLTTTLSGNTANSSSAGGVYSNGSHVSIDRSTISSNRADREGGGLYLKTTGTGAAASTLTNVTISGNRAGSDGGGIFKANTGDLKLLNVTIADNRTDGNGAGIVRNAGLVEVRNTLIAHNLRIQVGAPWQTSWAFLAVRGITSSASAMAVPALQTA